MTAALQAVVAGLKYIPASLGVKALSKINPKFKNFFTEAASYGYDANRALNYLTERFSNPNNQQFENQLERGAAQGNLRPDEAVARSEIRNASLPGKAIRGLASFGGAGLLGTSGEDQEAEQQGQVQQQPPQQSPQGPGGFLEFIKQNPELGKYLDQLIGAGMSPLQAATEAKKKRKFAPLIESIERSVGQSFEDLLGQLFQGSPQGQQAYPQKDKLTRVMELLQRRVARR